MEKISAFNSIGSRSRRKSASTTQTGGSLRHREQTGYTMAEATRARTPCIFSTTKQQRKPPDVSSRSARGGARGDGAGPHSQPDHIGTIRSRVNKTAKQHDSKKWGKSEYGHLRTKQGNGGTRLKVDTASAGGDTHSAHTPRALTHTLSLSLSL